MSDEECQRLLERLISALQLDFVDAKGREFVDGWHALHEFRDVLAKLADLDSEDAPPEVICALLVGCGVEDMTQREERSNEQAKPSR